MILADKRDLEASVRRQALEIRHQEFQCYVDNCNTLGAQAAFLAGLSWGNLDIDLDIPDLWLDMCFYISSLIGIGLHLCATLTCALCLIHAPLLAIRGPDGSIIKSLQGPLQPSDTFLQ